MATIGRTIKRIREVRQQQPKPTKHFEEYKPEYERILAEIEAICGDDGLKELADWAATRTTETRTLPTPEAMRTQARQLCTRRETEIPPGSALLPAED